MAYFVRYRPYRRVKRRVLPATRFQVAGDLTLQFGVGGLQEGDTTYQWGVGGLISGDVTFQWATAPGDTRIGYALHGRYGPVVAPLRVERRTKTNQFLADVTPAIEAVHIEGNNNRTVFRTATFRIDPANASINPLSDHLAVFTDLLVDGNYTLAIQWGLFALTVPRKTFSPRGSGGVQELWEVEANDNTIHLLEDGPGATYVIASGQNYITGTNAVKAILDGRGLAHALPSTTATLPKAMSWPADTSWATIVNDLLAGINHYTIKPDAAGTFRAREAADLANRTPDQVYTGDDFVLIPVTEEVETTRFANKVIATAGDLVSVATNADPDSPISTVKLGRTITRFIQANSAADQATLNSIAASYLRDGSYLYRRATLLTQPDPRRSFNEVYELTVDGLYAAERWAVQSWSVDLTPVPNPRMTHAISKISPVVVT